jgi:hypothetical protein
MAIGKGRLRLQLYIGATGKATVATKLAAHGGLVPFNTVQYQYLVMDGCDVKWKQHQRHLRLASLSPAYSRRPARISVPYISPAGVLPASLASPGREDRMPAPYGDLTRAPSPHCHRRRDDRSVAPPVSRGIYVTIPPPVPARCTTTTTTEPRPDPPERRTTTGRAAGPRARRGWAAGHGFAMLRPVAGGQLRDVLFTSGERKGAIINGARPAFLPGRRPHYGARRPMGWRPLGQRLMAGRTYEWFVDLISTTPTWELEFDLDLSWPGGHNRIVLYYVLMLGLLFN